MGYMTKKESKRVSKMIANKLTEMGIKDEITFSGSKVIKTFFKNDDNGVLITENGQPKEFKVEMPIATNIFRRTLKKLRNQHPDIINSFLGLNLPAQEVAPQEATNNLIT